MTPERAFQKLKTRPAFVPRGAISLGWVRLGDKKSKDFGENADLVAMFRPRVSS